MSAPSEASARFESKPLLLRILVGLLALAAGGAIFENVSVIVRGASGNWPAGQSMVEGLAWSGIGLLSAALLVSVCYAFYYLRRSAVRLFTIYVSLQVGALAIHCVRHPAWLTDSRNLASLAVHVAVTALVLGYMYSLKARAVLP